MKCPKCGAKVDDGATKCPSCGAAIEGAGKAELAEKKGSEEGEKSSQAYPPEKSFCIGAAVMLILMAVLYIFCLLGEISIGMTIITGYGGAASIVGIVSYYGFGIVLAGGSILAVIPVIRAISDPARMTVKKLNTSFVISVVLLVLSIIIWAAMNILEGMLTSDVLCTLYYACYCYGGSCILCAVAALVAAVLLRMAMNRIAKKEQAEA